MYYSFGDKMSGIEYDSKIDAKISWVYGSESGQAKTARIVFPLPYIAKWAGIEIQYDCTPEEVSNFLSFDSEEEAIAWLRSL